jgi:nicotinate-nucleotide adenylyltransferase
MGLDKLSSRSPIPLHYHRSMDLPALDCRRVAFFGGTFDPPHRGHIAIARAAQRALHLDAIIFAPVGTQPLKPQGSTASFEDRVAMTRLSVEGDPTFTVSLIDAPSAAGEPNYSIDTLTTLRDQLPAGADLFLLLGADSFLSLHHWHRGAEIPFVAPLIVASRPGQSLENLSELLPPGLSFSTRRSRLAEKSTDDLRIFTIRNASGASSPFFLLPNLDYDISASALREQIRTSEEKSPAVRNLLPDAVYAYISARGLYR